MTESLTHGGGAVFDLTGRVLRVLVVRARRPPHDWVLPKGHIEPGETPEQTAVREVEEESGVTAEILAPAGDDRFSARGALVVVRYFAMRRIAEAPSSEGREIRWCQIDEVVPLLMYERAREIVRNGFEIAEKIARAGAPRL
jgi:8-oxo-dGTP pyrophosphatase MutT (NUDIX family)